MARMGKEVALGKYEGIKQFLYESEELSEIQKVDLHKLFDYLENETGWLTAPASTRYHNSFEVGLIEHSINVVNTGLLIKRAIAPDMSDTPIVLTGILHDCGKSNMYKRKEPTARQKQYGYPGSMGINEDIPYMEHEDRGLYMITKYYPHLTEEEYCAIAQHNEPWLTNTCQFKRNRLMTILQNADYWACLYLDEPGESY